MLGHALINSLQSGTFVWSELALSHGTTKKVTSSVVGLAYERLTHMFLQLGFLGASAAIEIHGHTFWC